MSDNIIEAEAEAMEQANNLVQYHSKIVGVTFDDRQSVIAQLNGSEPLRVRREPENKFDKNAVAIDAYLGEDIWAPIGYIAKDKNSDLVRVLDGGGSVFIKIASLTGGGKDAKGKEKSRGVNISLEYVKPQAKPKKAPVAEASESVVERELTPRQKFELAIDEFENSMSGQGTKKIYYSRLTGKSTEVTVINGHVSLPGYLSGSAFPKKFYADFNEEEMLQKIVDKYYSDADEDKQKKIKESLLAMWGLNREASTGYGTAIHAALENYDTYHKLGDKTKKVEVLKTKTNTGPNKALSRNPFLKKIVEDFHEKFGGDYIRLSEQFIWTHEAALAGSIDRVKVIDAAKKVIRIQDYKTDGDIHEKKYQIKESVFKKEMGNELLDLHWLQLSFYAHILTKYHGYTVEGLDIYWLNPEKLCKGENAWEEFKHDVIDIEKGL